MDATAAGTSSEGAAQSSVAWKTSLIFDEFGEEPQSSERIHASLIEKLGAAIVPSLRNVQAALSARGEKMGGRKVYKGRQVLWVRRKPGEELAGSASKGKKKRRLSKPLSKKKAEQMKRERAADCKAALEERADELLARPMTAFMIFGFSQRGILKKQKSAQAVREIVKAVGERWLLLTDVDRAKYEAMAEEDAQRARVEAQQAADAAARAQQEAEEQDVEHVKGGDEGAEDASEDGASYGDAADGPAGMDIDDEEDGDVRHGAMEQPLEA
jgi:hypothetical protein